MDNLNGTISETTEPSGGSAGDAPRLGAVRLKTPPCDVRSTIYYEYGFDWLSDHIGGWQLGEQGIIGAIAEKAGITKGQAVEFGIGTTVTCEHLFDAGWRGTLIDCDKDAWDSVKDRWPGVVAVLSKIETDGPMSIDNILEKSEVSGDIDLMVIDIDSHDYYVFESLQKYRPKMVMIEHHDFADITKKKSFTPSRDECGKPGKDGYLAQVGAENIRRLARSRGYYPVFTTRLNSFFVVKEIADKIFMDGDGEIRLNVGAGDRHMPGFVSLDIKTGTDVSAPLPYETGTVEEVYASHVLEHIDPKIIPQVVCEWVRVLKPDGILRICVPDIGEICKNRNMDNSWLLDLFIYGGNTDKHDVHRWGFDHNSLARIMGAAGIGHIQKFDPINDDCSKTDHSLNLCGTKRAWKRVEKPKITLVISQPRLAFTDQSVCIMDLAHVLGSLPQYEFTRCFYGGAFWDRDTAQATKEAIKAHNPDFLLYCDYDGVFTPQDVITLIETLQSCPEAAGAFGVQMSRHNDEPLVFMPERDYTTMATKVDFAHFGLTVLRPDIFSELDEPWFWSMPGRDERGNPSGWDAPLESDADITFWRGLKELGFVILQRNDVIVGHMVLSVKWPSDTPGGFMLQPIESYRKTGRPKTAKFNADVYRASRARKLAGKTKAVSKEQAQEVSV